jgi:hypothetical protein
MPTLTSLAALDGGTLVPRIATSPGEYSVKQKTYLGKVFDKGNTLVLFAAYDPARNGYLSLTEKIDAKDGVPIKLGLYSDDNFTSLAWEGSLEWISQSSDNLPDSAQMFYDYSSKYLIIKRGGEVIKLVDINTASGNALPSGTAGAVSSDNNAFNNNSVPASASVVIENLSNKSTENNLGNAPIGAPVISNPPYPAHNVINTYANNLVAGTLAGSAPTLAKNSFDYKFYNLGGGRYGVQEKGASKIDEITGASSLKFVDQSMALANDIAATFNQVKGIDDVSGVVFRIYNAAFSRLPDTNGLQNWINGNASGGMTYASSAQSFSESQEFKNRYGSNVTDTQFITTLYNNVLGRAPDAAGLSHYQSLLAGGRSRGALLLDFSESPENRVLFTQVTGLA